MSPPTYYFDPDDNFIDLRIIAAMAWPNSIREQELSLTSFASAIRADLEDDAGRRARVVSALHMQDIAAKHGLTMDDMRQLPEFDAEMERGARWLEDDLEQRIQNEIVSPAGGWKAISKSQPIATVMNELRRAAKEGTSAAKILLLVLRIHEQRPDLGASLNLALSIIRKERAGTLAQTSEVTMKKYWAKWRCVAPLHAAHRLMCEAMVAKGINPLQNLDLFAKPQIAGAIIGWAKWLSGWGVTFKASKAGDSFLPSDEAHVINGPVKAHKPLLRPLSDEEVKWAELPRQ